jgi:signal transduction histidine kinase
MLVSRRADTDQRDAIPFSLLAVRRSLRSFRRFLLVGAIGFVAIPLALFAVLEGTPLQYLPLTLTIAGLFWLRIESLALERDLRRARVQALDAIELERERIQRDLHDSAQQRLVSSRIHLGLLAQSADRVEDRDAAERIGRELDAALGEIRNVTRDSSPQLLLRDGVVESLRAVADHTPRVVIIESVGFGRYEPKLERAIYYGCLEALQNAVKHGGSTAAVWVRLVGDPHQVSFSVDDSGAGFDPGRVSAGAGLMNLADRVDVLGGHLTIDSLPGMGTRIRAVVPLEPSQVLPTLSSSPARSGVRARLGAGVDVGARAEVYRSRGEPDQG